MLSKREEWRATEVFFKVLLKPVNLFFPKFFNIPVSTMAKAMLNKTMMPAAEKFEILENKDMQRVGAN